MYKGDVVIDNINDNINKRKIMLSNNKIGVSNNCNVRAFTKNMCNTYNNQECAPNFVGNLYKSRQNYVMSSKLQKLK